MPANLIDLAKGFLTSEVTHKISAELGESPERVEKAIDAGIPSILAGFLNTTASSSGPNRLFEMLNHEPSELSHVGGLDGVLGNMGSLLGGGSLDTLLKYGQSLLGVLFGGKQNAIVETIAKSSGLNVGSAGSLLGMLAPMLMGLLRQQTVDRGSSPTSLTNLLLSQKDAIAKAAPAGLSSALGLKSLSDLGGVTDSIKMAGAGAARGVGHTATAAASGATSWLRWAVPLALLAAVLGGLYYWSTGQGQVQNPAGPAGVAEGVKPALDQAASTVADAGKRAGEKIERATEAVTDAGKRATEAVTDAGKRAGEKVADAGKRLTAEGKALVETVSRQVSLSLPGGIKLDVPENSSLHAMAKFLTDGATSAKTFVADKLDFEGVANKLSADSSTTITSLATIMKAFGTAKLEIQGHTDNASDPAENKRISLERATAVKDALVKAGVPAARITVAGVGADRPIASNDTEEGRAKNRRIELAIVPR
jgi:outer membrane protein OmpA-like peptidoglycan-associated protein